MKRELVFLNEVDDADDIYSEKFIEELEDNDEISPEEQGFMEGYLEA